MTERVIVGISGGVDSAVAALRLQQAGYAVEGLFMFNWSEDEAGRCQAADDFEAAQAVCDILGIPLHRADFSHQYRERVFRHFLDGYAAGRTPNPDVLCNREIKFDSFLDHARRLGADRIATGHYAQIRVVNEVPQLLRGADPDKDQSYFLAAVPASALARTLFPLGETHKAEVRAIAREHGLPNHARADSTGVCFIGERDFAGFLSEWLTPEPGPIRAADGARADETIGQHRGLLLHTIGQRKGLGIGGVRGTPDAPWYVVAKDMATQTLWVSQNPEHPYLRPQVIHTRMPDWVDPAPELPLTCSAQVRYRQRAQSCRVEQHTDGLTVSFDAPQQTAVPGQFAVFYDADRCLGCAEIDAVPTPEQAVA